MTTGRALRWYKFGLGAWAAMLVWLLLTRVAGLVSTSWVIVSFPIWGPIAWGALVAAITDRMCRIGLVLALLLKLLVGCGSVEVAQLAAGDAGADQGGDASTDLDPPASDSSAENPPDAGGVEVDAGPPAPPACRERDGTRADPVEVCGPSCATCQWANFATPAPHGCTLPSGALCVTDCAACP